MENYGNSLPEEQDERSQPLIEDLRRAYQLEFHNPRSLTRVRERLLAGDGGQEQTKQIPFPQQGKKSGTMERQGGKFKTLKPKRGQRALSLAAAILVISFLAGSLVLTLHLARGTFTDTGPGSLDGRPGIIIEMHMFSDSTGWALSEGNRVLRTTNGGASWQEVTPPDLQVLEHRFMLAGPRAFYDAATAWVEVTVNAQQTPEYHSPTAALLFHTTDGGKTWQETVLKLSGQRAGQLLFVNAHVGWLVAMPEVTIQGPERDTPFDIWHTTDGGKTWTKILDGSSSSAHLLSGVTAPVLSFGDEQVGLMVGQNHRLYRTVDGGVTWQLQPWPAVTGSAVNFGEPHFFTPKDALFTSTTMTFGSSAFAKTLGIVVYTTHDAGLTWHTSPTFSLVAPQDKQAHVGWTAGDTPTFIDMQHGWIAVSTEATTTVTGQSSLVQYLTIDGGQHWMQLPASSIPNNHHTESDYASFSFISPSVGWVVIIGSSGGVVLLKTVDGGHTWTQIHARFPSFIRVSSPSS